MRNFGWLAAVAMICFAAGNARAADANKKTNHYEKKFKQLDANGDGTVSLDEFVNYTPKHPHKTAVKNRTAHRTKKFNKMDTNHDGKLTLDEFVAWKQAHHHARKNGAGKHHKHSDANNGAAPAPAPAPDTK